MASSFYHNACDISLKHTPFPGGEGEIVADLIDESKENGKMEFHRRKDGKRLQAPHSIMNDNVAINYRTIYNGYPSFTDESGKTVFTQHDDYLRCVNNDEFVRQFEKDKKNPTYQNILKYYSDPKFDPNGVASYKLQDFLFLKYYNQIPNNYMITLRRYISPCDDHMFGLDFPAVLTTSVLNGKHPETMALATAVTYFGEKTGNKLSDILKFEYGANYENKEAKVEVLKNSDGGLAAQLKQNGKVSDSLMNGELSFNDFRGDYTGYTKQAVLFAAATTGAGTNVNAAIASQHVYEGDTFGARYGNEFYGDVNVIQNVKMRSRGLTYTNNFSLTFEYSLKSLKCVNPRIAMMDILVNFLLLTGNYGEFWGGATRFYGQHNIAPQFGNPVLLRNGDFGGYFNSLWNDVKTGFERFKDPNGDGQGSIWEGIKNLISGAGSALFGNLLGGNVGVAGSAQCPSALLSGAPTGLWHVTVGNPLDPIAMMGNMCVTKTSVQFSDVLGYDDFPTEIKFVVDLEHGRPRDNGAIENMFNGAKGRFYAFTDKKIESEYHSYNALQGFTGETHAQKAQTVNMPNSEGIKSSNYVMKTVGGHLQI